MFFIGYISCKDADESRKIAKALLKERLVACANIVIEISSMYWWKGKIQHEKESLLLVKTSKNKINEIIERVEELHSYEIPCIEFVAVEGCNNDCKEWLERELK